MRGGAHAHKLCNAFVFAHNDRSCRRTYSAQRRVYVVRRTKHAASIDDTRWSCRSLSMSSIEDLEYVRSHRDRSSPVGPSDPIRPGVPGPLLRARTVVVGEKEEECTRTLIMNYDDDQQRDSACSGAISLSLSCAQRARPHTLQLVHAGGSSIEFVTSVFFDRRGRACMHATARCICIISAGAAAGDHAQSS